MSSLKKKIVSFGTRLQFLHNLVRNKIDLKKQILQAI